MPQAKHNNRMEAICDPAVFSQVCARFQFHLFLQVQCRVTKASFRRSVPKEK